MPSTAAKGHPSYAAEKIRQLYQPEDCRPGAELFPFFCVEARIDFNDVRTGFRETVSLSKALEIYSNNADLLWTDDMIRDVDLVKATPTVPEGTRLGALPQFVDAAFLARMEGQFIQYLLRSFQAKIYRNYELNLYSLPGESRSDFCRRCLELFESAKRQELDRLHEVLMRKLEQTKQKYLSRNDLSELEQARAESQNRNVFSRCSERITGLFYGAELPMKAAGPPQISSGMHELEEQLLALEWEANHAVSRVSDSYDEKANAVDEYILHPNLKDIHFVRSCILWMSRCSCS